MSDLDEFYVHTVTVEPYLGAGSTGHVFGDPVELPCFVAEETVMVRDGTGTEVVSSTAITADPGYAGEFRAGGRVALPSGDTTVILRRAVSTSGDLGLPDHVLARCE